MNRARRNTEQDGDQLSQAIICWNKAGLIDDKSIMRMGVIENFHSHLRGLRITADLLLSEIEIQICWKIPLQHYEQK